MNELPKKLPLWHERPKTEDAGKKMTLDEIDAYVKQWAQESDELLSKIQEELDENLRNLRK